MTFVATFRNEASDWERMNEFLSTVARLGVLVYGLVIVQFSTSFAPKAHHSQVFPTIAKLSVSMKIRPQPTGVPVP